MNDDPARCPECDFALSKAQAKNVMLVVDGLALNPCDVIYCSRCRWCRFATAEDLDLLAVLSGRT